MAGPDWYIFFINQKPSLSLQSPETTKLTWATSFKHTHMEAFMRNSLGQVIKKYNFDVSSIWNIIKLV